MNRAVGKQFLQQGYGQVLAERLNRIVWRVRLQFVGSHVGCGPQKPGTR
jgi:hypothetical protein